MGCVALVTLAAALQAQPENPPPGLAPEAVSLAGIPVGGKTEEEVRKLAEEYSARLLTVPLTVRHDRRTEKATPARLGAAVSVKKAVEAVFAPRPEPPNFLIRLQERFSPPEAVEIPFPVYLSEKGVSKGLARFALRIGAEPRNARLVRRDGVFQPIPPRPGRELDAPAMAAALQRALDAPDLRERVAASLEGEPDRKEWLKGQEPIELKAATRPAQPRVRLEHLERITHTLARFTTRLAGSRNRVNNIVLACRAIDGTVLLPGDTFSYNEVVGPRIPSAGYREAPQIVNGQLEPGIGGGICQVSSTLYNAALLADMQIVRRSHHSVPVHYLPAGRDATVSYGSRDFQFKNRLKHTVALDAKVTGGRVAFAIHGDPEDARNVRVLSSGVSRRAGGTAVSITRVVKNDDGTTRRETISRDYYKPPPAKPASARGTGTTRRRAGRREASDAPVSAPRPRRTPPSAPAAEAPAAASPPPPSDDIPSETSE